MQHNFNFFLIRDRKCYFPIAYDYKNYKLNKYFSCKFCFCDLGNEMSQRLQNIPGRFSADWFGFFVLMAYQPLWVI